MTHKARAGRLSRDALPRVEGPVACILPVLAAVFIQCRLLCNLFDGMVAVEGGKGTPSGELFNDIPDRIADPLILIAAGYATTVVPWAAPLGWAAGLGAVFGAAPVGAWMQRPGDKVLAVYEGSSGTVSVVERRGSRKLRFNETYTLGGTSYTPSTPSGTGGALVIKGIDYQAPYQVTLEPLPVNLNDTLSIGAG